MINQIKELLLALSEMAEEFETRIANLERVTFGSTINLGTNELEEQEFERDEKWLGES